MHELISRQKKQIAKINEENDDYLIKLKEANEVSSKYGTYMRKQSEDVVV